MLTYCLKSKKIFKNVDWKVWKTKNNRKMLLWKCAVKLVKNQDLLKNKKQNDY